MPALASASDNEKHVFFVGALAHLWSVIEELLDQWVEFIHDTGGSTHLQPFLPPNLDRELDYLSESIRAGLTQPGEAEQAAKIIQQIHRIKGFRHTLIHGRVIEIENGRVIVDHTRVRGSARIRARATFSHLQMLRHYSKAYALVGELRAFLLGEDDAEAEG